MYFTSHISQVIIRKFRLTYNTDELRKRKVNEDSYAPLDTNKDTYDFELLN